MDKLYFSCWYQPHGSESWEFLEKEAQLQVGLRAKPSHLPPFMWRYLLRKLLDSRFRVELSGGYIDDTSVGIRKE